MQCYAENAEYSGDNIYNPFVSRYDDGLTLAECMAACDTETDSYGRECVAIEWADGGNEQSEDTIRWCGLCWACDPTDTWTGGSIFHKVDGVVDSEGAMTDAAAFMSHHVVPENDHSTGSLSTESFILMVAGITAIGVIAVSVLLVAVWWGERRKRKEQANKIEDAVHVTDQSVSQVPELGVTFGGPGGDQTSVPHEVEMSGTIQ